jgi:hypothetical protein
MDLPRIAEAIDGIGKGVDLLKKKHEDELAAMRERVEELESRQKVPGRATGNVRSGELVFKSANGDIYPVLRKGELLSARVKPTDEFDDLGAWVNGQINGTSTKAVASGPALVDSVLSQRIIDAVRAKTTLIQAGALTVIVADGGTIMGRITGDPTVHQHTEGANDITVSDMTFDAVTLKPKALVARVPLTAEVVADSPNLNNMLEMSLAGAFAQKVDTLGLATIIADTNVPDSAAGQDPAVWLKVLEAVGAALAANQPLPTAMINNTADFIARASQLASTAGSWLGRPPALSNMVELPTTSITAGTALLGGFENAVVIAMRQALRFEVIRFADPGRYSHELVAHARVDAVVVQPGLLFKQLKTVT